VNAYREPEDAVAEIVAWIRATARNTPTGIGPRVDRNTAIIHSGLLLADEIERRWGGRAPGR
jgi:hypothetical protein